VAISTNLVFSDWNRIFKDPMTTMAAIDRVVHHSVILDLMGMDSYRARKPPTSTRLHLPSIEKRPRRTRNKQHDVHRTAQA
jgi:hypothetical protein